ncbi:MAG: hypothetical protein JWR04_446 [Rhodoglobus sp.]|nr:hypothetical protein [Rhodoglobus sp.]
MIDEDDAAIVCAERRGSLAAFVHVAGNGVTLTVTSEGRTVLGEVPVGPVVNGAAYGASSALAGVTRRTVVESFVAASGKARGPHSAEHTESVVTLRESDGTPWELVLRVAADGVAVRYRLPLLDGVASVEGDRIELPLDGTERLWMLDYQTWYETTRFGTDAPALAEGAYGLPALIRTAAGDHVLVTESGIDGRFSGSHLDRTPAGLRLVPADAAIEVTRGEVSPWRVFIVGGLAAIVESQFVDELAPPVVPELADAAWVRPGRAAWSWWSDFYSGAQIEHQMRLVDEAAELGWEHLLIDCGWDDSWVPEIVAYASIRGIQVHIWTVWRDLNGPENLRRLGLWRSWGVAGIKVDFMESESKDRYRWYDALLAEAARVGLMVNVHGSVIPRGWARTWPNLIGYEAARGAEYYVFYDEPLEPAHNVILPFTRNVLGAMDYTPVALSAPGRRTSDAHELALSVAFECGITHFADDTAVYLGRPLIARFLAELAPWWDETLLLAGDPDTEAVLARRHGDRWFIGGIATGAGRTLTVPLERLGLGPADAWVVTDAAADLAETTLSGVTELTVQLAADGGFAAIVAAPGTPLHRAAPRATVEPPTVTPAVAELVGDEATLTVSAGASLRLPAGWTSRAEGTTHTVRALAGADFGVITVEGPGDDGVPAVVHARIFRPLAAGEHRLSALPFLAFRNASGPVERDQSNGGGNPRDGQQQSIGGQAFDTGIGMAAPGWVQFHLGGRADSFSALVGIDDEPPFVGMGQQPHPAPDHALTARAAVLVDGVERAAFDLVQGGAATPVAVDVSGGQVLELRVSSPDREPHIDWADALLHVTAVDDGPHPTAGHR